MEARESFIFYRSFFEAVVDLPRDVRGEVLIAIIEYGLNGETNSQLKPIAKGMLTLIKPQIDANQVRYENGCKGGEFGKLGGAPKGNQNARKNNPKTTPKQPQNNPKTTPNDNVNDNDNNIKKTISNEIVKKSATNVATLEQRAISFYKSLVPFLEKYDKELIRAFYSYWSEPNQAKTKMRFEMERTWDTARRLSTWASREQKTLKNTSYGYKSYKQYDRDYQAEQFKQFAEDVYGKLQHAVGEI